MVSSDNFDEVLEAMGVSLVIRKRTCLDKPNVMVTVDQGVICLEMQSSFIPTEVKFKLNEPFNETTLDGRDTTNVVTLENGKLVQKQSWDGKETTIEREIVDGKLVMTWETDGVVGTRVFEAM